MAKDRAPTQSLPPAMWNAACLREDGPYPVLNPGFLMSLGPPGPEVGACWREAARFKNQPEPVVIGEVNTFQHVFRTPPCGSVTMGTSFRVLSLPPVCGTLGWALRLGLGHTRRNPLAFGAVAGSGGLPRERTSQLVMERCVGPRERQLQCCGVVVCAGDQGLLVLTMACLPARPRGRAPCGWSPVNFTLVWGLWEKCTWDPATEREPGNVTLVIWAEGGGRGTL